MGEEVFFAVALIVIGYVLLKTVGRNWIAEAQGAADVIKMLAVVIVIAVIALPVLLPDSAPDPAEVAARTDEITEIGSQVAQERVQAWAVGLVAVPIAGIIIATFIKPLLRMLK